MANEQSNTSETEVMGGRVTDSLASIDVRGRLMGFATAPSTVWFVGLWFYGIFSMIVFNMFRVLSSGGTFGEALFGGPSYYAHLFLFYGLNEKGGPTGWESGIGAWLIAPFLAVFMGITLFYLRDSGFAYNGNTRLEDPLLPIGDPVYAFFPEPVYGAGINLFGMKGNLFYIGIVWMPIILASITTIVYQRKVKRDTSLITRFVVNFIIAVWLGVQVAKMTDPNLSFSLPGFFESIFSDRRTNAFVSYEGQYHPMMLATAFTLYQVVPMLVLATFDGVINLTGRVRQERALYNQRMQYQRERQEGGISKLPWERDKSTQTEELSKEEASS